MGDREIRVFLDRGRDPVQNLAREVELLRSLELGESPETLRFWVNSPCLVRGKARSARYGWYNEAIANELGIQVLERSTGGGVVFHDEGNLNWSFFLRRSGAFPSPTATFGQVSRYMVKALEKLGVVAQFSPPNRIDVSGRKVSGMAARSTPRAQLVHGTLLLHTDLDRLNRLCIPPDGCPPVSNLSQWVRDVDVSTVVGAVIEALKDSGIQVKAMNFRG